MTLAFIGSLPRALAAGLLLALACAGCRTTTPHSGKLDRTMQTSVEGQRLRYRMRLPVDSPEPERGWPLLLFLHGAGERGDDLAAVERHGPLKLVHTIPRLARCVLVAPQCPSGGWWRPATLKALLDEVQAFVDVDPARIYVTGLSMGGYGTWGLLAESPHLFAAAVPICGGGQAARLDPALENGFRIERLLEARDVPIRVFHGADDDVVPLRESELLVHALRDVGADVEWTVYPGVGHDSWTRTYADPALYAWLLAQRRSAP